VVSLALAKARRQLRRAARLAAADRLTAALSLAEPACAVLEEETAWGRCDRSEVAAALVVVADLHLAQVALPAALQALDRLVALLEDAADEPSQDRLADALTRRGDTLRLQARYEPARADLCRALGLARSPLLLAGAHNASGILAKDTGRYDAAARHYRTALELAEQVHGQDSAALASLMHNLAGLEHACGRWAEGERFARLAMVLRAQVAGPDSVELAGDLAVLGALLLGQQRLDEAEAVFERALAIWTHRRGPAHYEVAVARHNLAAVHTAGGRLGLAREEYRSAWLLKRQVLGEAHPEVLVLAAELDHLRCREEQR
jgi:tetratricopeptide (TPR) repeat protein